MFLNKPATEIEMNEQEIKNLLSVYQQKVSELTTQTVALEARLMNSNQLIEALTKKVNELSAENEKLTSSKTRKVTSKEDSGEF
jgi:predicted RNase H-like nuclease (RuvC/YqgF family)